MPVPYSPLMAMTATPCPPGRAAPQLRPGCHLRGLGEHVQALAHPGLILARRLKRKASQVWLFATSFDVPATNNGSENAVRGYKLAAKISGCWRTWQRCSATAASAPTSPPHAATAATPSPPSATTSTGTAGCRRNQHDQLTGHP
jgi:hypothetical protein